MPLSLNISEARLEYFPATNLQSPKTTTVIYPTHSFTYVNCEYMIPNTYVCPLSIIQIDVLNVDDLKSDAAKSVCYRKFLTISPAITVRTCTASMV